MSTQPASQPAKTSATKSPDPVAWPDEVADITYLSAADGSMQPMRFHAPSTDESVPLLVYLHPWSCDYQFTDNIFYARWCMENQWAACFPNFRGPNLSPSTCGSELVVQDILNAVEYAKRHAAIDANRIYLMGASGGGYASLLMAGRSPKLWAGVSAWVPIFDLKDWHSYCEAKGAGYYQQMETVCGGAPGASPAVDEEYRIRSASAWLPRATNTIIDIAGGIHDSAIPIDHTLRAFNVLARPKDRIAEEDIAFITQHQRIPEHLRQPDFPSEASTDETISVNKLTSAEFAEILCFRRCSGNARVTIFNGGHEIVSLPGLEFLSRQRKGDPPAWE